MMKKVISKLVKKRKSMTSTRATKKTEKPKKAVRRKGISSEEFMNLIEKKAYDIWQKKGYSHGSDRCDWYKAEKAVNTLYKVK